MVGEVSYFRIKKDYDVKIYVHDPGEEFHFHYDLWPETPYEYRPQADEVAVDLIFAKEIRRQNDGCTNDESYNYYGMFYNVIIM